MFTLDATIDAVQTGKKTFVNTFVQNEDMKNAMIKFIDTQSEYTKKIAKQATDTATVITSELTKVAQEAAKEVTKFDYNKATESFQKMFKVAK